MTHVSPSSEGVAGIGELIALVDAAVDKQDVTDTVETIKADLCRLLRSGRIDLPPQHRAPSKNAWPNSVSTTSRRLPPCKRFTT